MVSKSQIRPIRIVLRWQLIVTAVLALAAAFPWGMDGALSAALGGAINLSAGWVYAWRVSRGGGSSAGEALRTIFRAWGMKVLMIFVLLWLVLANYPGIVHLAFFATFAITVAVFAAAIAVRDEDEEKVPPASPGGQ